MPNIFHLCTIKFPLTDTSCPKFDFFTFHPSGDQGQLHINFTFHIGLLNGIHTEELNLIKLKQENDLPYWYPIFKLPLSFPFKVSFTCHEATILLFYIDSSEGIEQ